MIKKLLEYELRAYLKYFVYTVIYLSSITIIASIIISIIPLNNVCNFYFYFGNDNIFEYLQDAYKFTMIPVLIGGTIVISQYINRNLLSQKGTTLFLIPIKNETLLITQILAIFLWNIIMLFIFWVLLMLGLGFFNLLNYNFYNLYYYMFPHRLNFAFFIELINYLFLTLTYVSICVFSTFIANLRVLRRFRDLLSIIIAIVLILALNSIIFLFILPIQKVWLKNLMILILSGLASTYCIYFSDVFLKDYIEIV